MKRLSLIFFFSACILFVQAQTWKAEVEKISGNTKTKTLRLKPSMQVNIQTVLSENDSLRESRLFYGDFWSGSVDSLQIRLKSTTYQKTFTSGIRHTTITPARFFVPRATPDSNLVKIALTDIASLDYKNEKLSGFGEIAEPVLLLSLLTLIASPLICYNFKDKEFNADRYKYWALGSTAGVFAGFAVIISVNAIPPHGYYQFKDGWPRKKAKIWRFK
ncbi:MAG TPA: hypothetical protein PK796_10305 [Bacteroidales bacterium]|jgi:hypothetical protein|nr:hypothetical protein [Bacteroidales bacterium]